MRCLADRLLADTRLSQVSTPGEFMNGNKVVAGSKSLKLSMAGLVAGLIIIGLGCGGGSSTTTNPGPKGVNATSQIKIGDAPADRVLAFEATVGPITLTPSNGSPVTALSGTRRIELSHLSGTSEPLALLNIPAGTYTSASIMVANPEVTFLNSSNVVQEIEPAFNQTITINFSPSLTIGSGASVVNIDLSIANALSFDSSGNVIGVNLSASSFTVSTSAVAGNQNNEQDDDGELEDITGMVTSVSGSTFTLDVGQNGTPLTFSTDANTEFDDGAALATMLNTIVKVEGITMADGSLFAKEVEGVEDSNGAEAEGLITAVTGNPATALSLVAQDGLGSGFTNTTVGTTLNVNVSGAQYKVDKGSVDTSGLSGGLPSNTFPFDATSVHAGQAVEVESDVSLNGNSGTAEKVKLKQQGLSGTVSGLSGATSSGPATFTLTVAADSAFAVLSGHTTVNVFWQPGTDLKKLSSVNNNDTVRVRGLVFFTSTGVNMIARRIQQ
jgi:hypothetical protein